MKEIPVAQILHPLGYVQHELHQRLHGDVLEGRGEQEETMFLKGKPVRHFHLQAETVFYFLNV